MVTLVEIAPPDWDVDIDLVYATDCNFTGQPVYPSDMRAWLHPVAADKLRRAVDLAARHGWRLRLFDAFRPPAVQWVLWNHTPDSDFLADPRKGSPHSRGVAVDLTLADSQGRPMDMGTGFDAFTPHSHHGNGDISIQAQQARYYLLGLMTSAGWDCYLKEWWHYQLFDAASYPLIEKPPIKR